MLTSHLPKTPSGVQTGVVPIDDVFSLSGLDFFKAMKNGDYPPPPICGTAHMDLLEVEEGRIVFSAKAEPAFFNPISTIHGGFAATVLDTGLGCSVHSTLKPGEAYTTMEIKVIYHRAILPETGDLRCEGVVISRGRRAAASEAKLYDANGKLLASGSSTCMIMPAPKSTS
ncbi:MAG: PaaI family thioesterase [Pseudomonadota bacterium]